MMAFYNSWDREAGQEDSFSNRTINLGKAGAQHRHRLSNLTNHTIDHNKPRHQQATSKQIITNHFNLQLQVKRSMGHELWEQASYMSNDLLSTNVS